ncbi:MAG: hypothetical protein AB7S46_14520, partial [Flavobacteriaceae bacterium]
MPGRQLVMNLAPDPSFGRDDFLASPANRAARERLTGTAVWRGAVLVLIGPAASGKSHLAAIWAEDHAAAVFTAGQAVRADQLRSAPAVVIEDCDEGFADETLMFHLFNEATTVPRPILMTARAEPGAWPLQTRDLASRLRGADSVSIEPPDDELIAALFVKHCADRQLAIEAPALKAALPRVERSYAFVRDVVAELDRETLSQ